MQLAALESAYGFCVRHTMIHVIVMNSLYEKAQSGHVL